MKNLLFSVLIVIATLGFPLSMAIFFALSSPVHAAPPAPVEVKECQKINTATITPDMVIVIFRCESENGVPYLINSFGFMKDEE